MNKLTKALAILVLVIGVLFTASTINFAVHIVPALLEPPRMDYSSGDPKGDELPVMAIPLPFGDGMLVRSQATALLASEIVGSLVLLASGYFLLRHHWRSRMRPPEKLDA
jgi:hypothetical protein